ncbi:MAG: DUF433 domain-containing protein, partial [Thermomicrobiales bacterium]|nr:DUF433 domain-containing protein [Thermomicrobiales bacterium]
GEVRAFLGSDVAEEAWANQQFYVVGSRVFLTNDDALRASQSLGQQVAPAVRDLGSIVAEIHAALRELQVRSEHEIGRVASARAVMGGMPVVAGTRIPAATVAWFSRKGYSVEEILAEFPRLTRDDITAALEAEGVDDRSLRQRLAG